MHRIFPFISFRSSNNCFACQVGTIRMALYKNLSNQSCKCSILIGIVTYESVNVFDFAVVDEEKKMSEIAMLLGLLISLIFHR